MPWVRLHAIKDYLDMLLIMDKYPKLWNETPFTQANYNKYWNIDVFYSLAITSDGQQGTPTEAYVTAAKNADDWTEK